MLLSILCNAAIASDHCDGHPLGLEWCMLKGRIPCHDLSCQIRGSPRLALDCRKSGLKAAKCAEAAAPLCAADPSCVAFGVYITKPPAWVEW